MERDLERRSRRGPLGERWWQWRLGAAATLTAVEEALGGEYLSMAKMLALFAGRQIRNRATLGGNLVTASPIGDSAPVLMTLGASVKLVSATGGRTYPNVNPATEEVIGQVADATREDMDRAIGAARRAFDTTDWSSNLAKRAKCLRQLQAALSKHKEALRPQVIAEVGTPIMLTYAVQQDSCIQDMLWDLECAEK